MKKILFVNTLNDGERYKVYISICIVIFEGS